MKTILTETISVIKVSLFWALALPAATIIFPVVAGWEKLNSLLSQSPTTSTRHFGSQIRAVAR